jgi:hypothetical protein
MPNQIAHNLVESEEVTGNQNIDVMNVMDYTEENEINDPYADH